MFQSKAQIYLRPWASPRTPTSSSNLIEFLLPNVFTVTLTDSQSLTSSGCRPNRTHLQSPPIEYGTTGISAVLPSCTGGWFLSKVRIVECIAHSLTVPTLRVCHSHSTYNMCPNKIREISVYELQVTTESFLPEKDSPGSIFFFYFGSDTHQCVLNWNLEKETFPRFSWSRKKHVGSIVEGIVSSTTWKRDHTWGTITTSLASPLPVYLIPYLNAQYDVQLL